MRVESAIRFASGIGIIQKLLQKESRRRKTSPFFKVPNLSEDQLLLHSEVAVIENGHFEDINKFIDAEEEVEMSEMPPLLRELVLLLGYW